jgi:alpha-glucuronidase
LQIRLTYFARISKKETRFVNIPAEDGYDLWLRYRAVNNTERLAQYRDAIRNAVVFGTSATAAVIKSELERALSALLDHAVRVTDKPIGGNELFVGTVDELKAIGVIIRPDDCRKLGDEGFLIRSPLPYPPLTKGRDESGAGTPAQSSDNWTIITGNSAPAVLTGTFSFLRILQTHQDIRALDWASRPRILHRILGHWDNLDGSIERGYAGRSLWNWDALPEKIDARYHDYARACASIGINGSCVNNVNANPKSLTHEYLEKTAALADVFRLYGTRIYLSPNFSAPVRIGGLATCDPHEASVTAWWKKKVDEIYRLIPDFGGFQVKANSEGQPGPQDYGATHADGANMLADALVTHGGLLLWRAFVYDTTVDPDRAKCANIGPATAV